VDLQHVRCDFGLPGVRQRLLPERPPGHPVLPVHSWWATPRLNLRMLQLRAHSLRVCWQVRPATRRALLAASRALLACIRFVAQSFRPVPAVVPQID
jgi:hypothetical protein